MYKPYTYQVFDPITDKLYIGSKTSKNCNPENSKEYLGSPRSGEYKEILSTRPNTLIKTILATWETKQETLSHEVLLHDCFNVGKNDKFFNQANQTSTGFACCGHSEETKHKIKIKNIGKPCKWKGKESPRKGIPNSSPAWNKGLKGVYKTSEETKLKMSIANKGKAILEETKLKISIANKGKKRTEEQKAHLSTIVKQSTKMILCPHCKKETDQRNAKRWHFDNCQIFTGIKNTIQKLKGVKKTEAHKMAMRKPKRKREEKNA